MPTNSFFMNAAAKSLVVRCTMDDRYRRLINLYCAMSPDDPTVFHLTCVGNLPGAGKSQAIHSEWVPVEEFLRDFSIDHCPQGYWTIEATVVAVRSRNSHRHITIISHDPLFISDYERIEKYLNAEIAHDTTGNMEVVASRFSVFLASQKRNWAGNPLRLVAASV